MVIDPRGSVCRCGARGCWETVVGRDAIGMRAGRPDDATEAVDVAEIVASARQGDPTARSAVEETGEWLGIGLGNLVNILDPEVIVLGGHLRHLYPQVQEAVQGHIHRAMPATRSQVWVTAPGLGGRSEEHTSELQSH